MNPWQRARTITQLHKDIPLIGRWAQRRARARRLAKDGAATATLALAQAIVNHRDTGVHEIAMQALAKTQRQPSIDAICQAWESQRHPWLANLIRKQGWVAARPVQLRVLSALQAQQLELLSGSNASMTTALIQAAQDPEKKLAQTACSVLAELHKPSAIDVLWAEWVEKRLSFLEKILVARGALARRPEEIRLISALKTGRRDIACDISGELAPALLRAAQDVDPVIASAARQALSP